MQSRAGELPEDKLIVTYCTCKAEETSLEAAMLLSKGWLRAGGRAARRLSRVDRGRLSDGSRRGDELACRRRFPARERCASSPDR